MFMLFICRFKQTVHFTIESAITQRICMIIVEFMTILSFLFNLDLNLNLIGSLATIWVVETMKLWNNLYDGRLRGYRRNMCIDI